MEKIEKLKELNKTITDICIDLETKIFVEDMDINEERIIKDFQPEGIETKIII